MIFSGLKGQHNHKCSDHRDLGNSCSPTDGLSPMAVILVSQGSFVVVSVLVSCQNAAAWTKGEKIDTFFVTQGDADRPYQCVFIQATGDRCGMTSGLKSEEHCLNLTYQEIRNDHLRIVQFDRRLRIRPSGLLAKRRTISYPNGRSGRVSHVSEV